VWAVCGCLSRLSLCVPVMDWRPVQGEPRLSPYDRWNRLQPPRDPTDGLSGYRKWMDGWTWIKKENTTKTKELDFRRKHGGDDTPLWINGTHVEQVHSLKYLGLHISDNISWSINTKEIRKEEQHFLRLLGRNISVWHAGSTAADKKSLQRIIRTA